MSSSAGLLSVMMTIYVGILQNLQQHLLPRPKCVLRAERSNTGMFFPHPYTERPGGVTGLSGSQML